MKKSLEMFTGKRKKITTILIGVFILIAISLACNLPFKIVWNGGSETDQTASDQVKTDADDVSAASKDQGEESKVEESVEGDQVLPSETPTATPSATETVTPTPEPAIANVEQNINCRLGPKDVYDLVHIFSKGDVVNILGKNEAETFWFVEDQGSGSIKCWLWREYTNTEGATKYVPVFTPPPEPPPTMNFVVTYKGSGNKYVHVYVLNTGNLPIQSHMSTFKDTKTGELLTITSNTFGSSAKISVGNTAVVASPQFSADPTGHQMKVTVKACSTDGQTGKCLSKNISFVSK